MFFRQDSGRKWKERREEKFERYGNNLFFFLEINEDVEIKYRSEIKGEGLEWQELS